MICLFAVCLVVAYLCIMWVITVKCLNILCNFSLCCYSKAKIKIAQHSKKKSEHKTKSGYETEICPICYESLNNCLIVITQCKHAFHGTCLKHWVKINDSCPLCRKINIYRIN